VCRACCTAACATVEAAQPRRSWSACKNALRLSASPPPRRKFRECGSQVSRMWIANVVKHIEIRNLLSHETFRLIEYMLLCTCALLVSSHCFDIFEGTRECMKLLGPPTISYKCFASIPKWFFLICPLQLQIVLIRLMHTNHSIRLCANSFDTHSS
jgi:hypothetical protein